MFEHWDSFYLLLGGASGGLMGLVFIVVTLISGVDAKVSLRSASVYMTPIIVHLGTVLVLSALATAPGLPDIAIGVIVGGCALAGLICALRVVVMLGPAAKGLTPAHWTDIWAYGVIPVAGYLIVGAGAAAVWLAPDWAPRVVALGLVALLLIAIRNAWDLVTWISAKGDQLGKD